jgi:hypothetical protein
MSCPACGTEIPNDSAFCLKCGKTIDVRAAEQSSFQVEKVPPSRSFRFSPLGAFMIGGLLVLLSVVYLQNSRSTPHGQSQRGILRPFTKKITSGTMTVEPGQCRYLTFQVNQAGLVNARVVGAFQSAGGLGNDIQAVLAEQSEFQNWINGHPARVLYSSPKTTTGKLDVPIVEPGVYVLGFSNKFSLLTAKNVSADVELQYLIR